jgi:TonB family protein
MQQNADLVRGLALACLIAAASSMLKPGESRAQEGSAQPAPSTQQLLQLPTFDSEPASSQEKTGTAANDAVDSYIEPVPIQKPAPIWPLGQLGTFREGWAALSFIVSPEGQVTQAMVEASSGNESVENAALNAVQKWRYKPATLNGVPVEHAITRTIIRFQVEGGGGARAGFVNDYRQTQEMIARHDLDHARAMLANMESHARFNLYEDAWFWWLKYVYMEAAGGTSVDDRREMLHRAIGYELDYLPADVFVVASVRLFNLEIAASNFAGALDAADRLKASKTAKSAKNYPDAIAALDSGSARIRTAINGDSTLKVTGTVSNHDYWVHGLLRWSFSIGEINGRLDLVEIRCARGNVRYSPVTAEHTWTVPRTWGGCSAYIKGEPGTTFVIYEYPNKS